MRVLTVKQPWADLIMSGQKPVENRSWPVPSTLPQWKACARCDGRWDPTGGRLHMPSSASLSCGDAYDKPCVVYDDGPFPFTLGIHAAAKPVRPEDAPVAWVDWAGLTGHTRPEDAPLGVLLGTVRVTGCHHADECYRPRGLYETTVGEKYLDERWCSRWAEPDCHHWQLSDPEPLDVPVPMRGRQGLWTLTEVTA